MYTAGKITIATALSGILIFAFVFLFNAGKTEILRVEAQTASTTLTVLNTPPRWVASSTEQFESSVSSPTNSGDLVSWVAVAEDPNGASYYLLICSTSATPSSTNSGAPRCNSGVQWGVSTLTNSNTVATVSTTTTEVAPFATSSNWFAWICDADAVSARCNDTFTQGTNATNSSPFIVNFRPTFSGFFDNSPADPGAVVTFSSTSSDPDGNNISLIVCNAATYSTTTNNCAGDTIATTSGSVASNATALYTLPAIIRDRNYAAFGYLIDQFGHEAIGGIQGTDSVLVVNNVAPTVTNGTIEVNGGFPITLTQEGAETTGFELAFETSDANSCRTAADALEITNFVASVFRSSVGTSSCNGATAGQYNPNNCYPSAVATSTWNLLCTASSTSCTVGGGDATMDWSCTFPLWYVADPTDSGSFYFNDDWRGAVAGVDDDNATGTLSLSAGGVELGSFAAIDLLSASIPYGQLEPGQDSGILNASTTIISRGNTGVNHTVDGESMCTNFSVGNDCVNSATSTIPESNQEFGTSSVSYGSGITLSSSTPQLVDLRVRKSTSTATSTTGTTYWGIGVPASLTLSGSYSGLNTFYVAASATSTWY